MQSPKNEEEGLGTRRLPCPMHGCKRVYAEVSSLESHVLDHEGSAQSLPGKQLLCSSSSCSASFPSMQKLMEHARLHYKPNIYFQCESCRTKLRSYRGLLAHLHTCSKVPRPKPKVAEPSTPPHAASNVTFKADLAPPKLESASSQQVPAAPTSAPSAVPQPEAAEPPVLGPPVLTLQEAPASQRVTDASPQPSPREEVPRVAACVRPITHKAALELPDVQPAQVRSTPGPAAYTTAVWRKNQAVSSHRRVLWEHTRGRYTCIQCGHAATNRKEMTQHISSHHSGAKAGEDAGSSVPKS